MGVGSAMLPNPVTQFFVCCQVTTLCPRSAFLVALSSVLNE